MIVIALAFCLAGVLAVVLSPADDEGGENWSGTVDPAAFDGFALYGADDEATDFLSEWSRVDSRNHPTRSRPTGSGSGQTA
jgi:hypothetical protein